MNTSGPRPAATDALPTAAQLQRAIASVPGVTGAEVSRGSNGRDRLRISLAAGEDPEAVAWSVAATLRERFGIALDPAAISARTTVADPSDDPVRVIRRVDPGSSDGSTATWPPPATEPRARPPVDDRPPPSSDLAEAARATMATDAPEPAPSRRRAAICRLSAVPVGDDLDVAATLRLADREVVGRARGLRTRRGRWRAISEATLDALGSLSGARVRGHVDHVTVLTFADLAHVSVSVTLLTDRGEETFLGAALVRDDPDRAVMRATLDAVNRRIEPWLAGTAEAG